MINACAFCVYIARCCVLYIQINRNQAQHNQKNRVECQSILYSQTINDAHTHMLPQLSSTRNTCIIYHGMMVIEMRLRNQRKIGSNYYIIRSADACI